MEPYYWSSASPHQDNTVTMLEYLDSQDKFKRIDFVDGSYAEGVDHNGVVWAIHASGAGDWFNHKVEFELLN